MCASPEWYETYHLCGFFIHTPRSEDLALFVKVVEDHSLQVQSHDYMGMNCRKSPSHQTNTHSFYCSGRDQR